jgi:predicted Zn-dependent peptidase
MPPKRTALATGAQVVSQTLPGVESVAVGLYFPTGSRHETLGTNGISHFIEHLVFKGTSRRSADQINREIDVLGGASNAYTGKETLCLHARVLAEHLPRIVELLGDLAAHALPPGLENEVDQEREVILAEISATEDSPEDLVGDLSDLAYFGEHPLALPVVGSARAVSGLALDQIRRHFSGHVVARQMVVAAAGRLEHEALLALVGEHLHEVPTGGVEPEALAPCPSASTRVIERDLEQVHVSLSAAGVTRADPRRPAAELLSVILGEGFSSRLFREVRDRRGLAYAIGSSLQSYTDSGSLNVYLAVTPQKLDAGLEVVGRVLAELRRSGVDPDELEAAKLHVRGGTLLALESSGGRMAYLAEQALLRRDDLDYRSDLAEFEAVSLDEVNALARELLAGRLALAAVGPVRSGRFPSGGWEIAP